MEKYVSLKELENMKDASLRETLRGLNGVLLTKVTFHRMCKTIEDLAHLAYQAHLHDKVGLYDQDCLCAFSGPCDSESVLSVVVPDPPKSWQCGCGQVRFVHDGKYCSGE